MAVTELSALELRDAIAGGEASAEEATRAYLAAVERREPAVAAFNEVLAERAVERAQAVGQRICGELASVGLRYGSLDSALGLSMGIASLNMDHPGDGDKLVAMADKALYAAKARPNSQVVVYTSMSSSSGASVA